MIEIEKLTTSDQEKNRLTALRTIVNKHQAKCNSKEMTSSLVVLTVEDLGKKWKILKTSTIKYYLIGLFTLILVFWYILTNQQKTTIK